MFVRNKIFWCVVLIWVAANVPTHLYSQKPAKTFDDEHRIQLHLDSGEFPRAIELIAGLPSDRADHFRGLLFDHQQRSGATVGAARTASNIRDDRLRSKHLATLQSVRNGSRDSVDSGARPGNTVAGIDLPSAGGDSRGGITKNDYEPLVNLITNTIAGGKWSDEGGPFVIHPFPAGVFVDNEGTLKRISIDPANFHSLKSLVRGNGQRQNWYLDVGNRNPHWPSTQRKVSLTRLQKAVQIRIAMGLPIDDAMSNFAGLTSIQYVFADPDTDELIVAGPAGAWELDSIGRAVHRESRHPILQLDDFVVCLRNAWFGNGKFGCTIDPRRENLTRAAQMIQSPQAKFHQREWQQKLREALGQQDIRVFGIDERTHAASVLVEADHHMKLVGMGLEPSIPQVASYFDRIKIGPENKAPNDVVRWWFTAKETEIRCNANRQLFELGAVGVRVQSESEFLREDGERVHTGNSTAPTQGFARDFTQHFDAMAACYPIYRELRNVFELALVANLIKQEKMDQRTNLDFAFLTGAGETNGIVYPVRFGKSPKQVDSVVNEKLFERRVEGSLLRTTVIGVSGGVDVDAASLVRARSIGELKPSELTESAKTISESDQIVWWWD